MVVWTCRSSDKKLLYIYPTQKKTGTKIYKKKQTQNEVNRKLKLN